MPRKKIVIVGAGPGGLSAAMLLAHRGHEVHIFEKRKTVGGRNAELRLGEYRFDTGPTFLMMPFVFRDLFRDTGRKIEDYADLIPLDILYRLNFSDGTNFMMHADKDSLRTEIENLFPGEGENYLRFLEGESKKFDVVYPCLQCDYSHWYHYFRLRFLRALPKMDLHKSVHGVVSRYFTDEKLRIAMTFQAKYLGMSPWKCPGVFTILPFIEHRWGVFHVRGGFSSLTDAMAHCIEEDGGIIHTNTPAKKIMVKSGTAVGIELEDGRKIEADQVIINADFGYAMTKLSDSNDRKKYTDALVNKKRYSVSTAMLYLGVRKRYDIPHHNIFFARDYKKNVEEIVDGKMSEDFSFYVQNSVVSDPESHPEGKSALYVLVPAPNTDGDQSDWDEDLWKENILSAIEQRTELKDIRSHLEEICFYSPNMWSEQYDVHKGAVFNLSHDPLQMLYLRPRNKFEEWNNCYLVGGGTHPGSGLPTIIQSGRISADLIEDSSGSQSEG